MCRVETTRKKQQPIVRVSLLQSTIRCAALTMLLTGTWEDLIVRRTVIHVRYTYSFFALFYLAMFYF